MIVAALFQKKGTSTLFLVPAISVEALKAFSNPHKHSRVSWSEQIQKKKILER